MTEAASDGSASSVVNACLTRIVNIASVQKAMNSPVNYKKGDCLVAQDRCEKKEPNVGTVNFYDKEMKIPVDMYPEAFRKVTLRVDKLR